MHPIGFLFCSQPVHARARGMPCLRVPAAPNSHTQLRRSTAARGAVQHSSECAEHVRFDCGIYCQSFASECSPITPLRLSVERDLRACATSLRCRIPAHQFIFAHALMQRREHKRDHGAAARHFPIDAQPRAYVCVVQESRIESTIAAFCRATV